MLGSFGIDNMRKTTPRGIRNNNPLNIRIGNTWLGERSNPTDQAFEEFVAIEYGYRAAFCILRRYIRRYNKNTITAIVSTWAPASENDTQRYIAFVADKMKMAADETILYSDRERMIQLVAAMQLMECGVPADMAKVEKGYDMA
jgi:hypothetical protein